MIYFGSANHKKKKKIIGAKNKMANKKKMATKHEFSIAQPIFMQIN
jgi:hypothetical protein